MTASVSTCALDKARSKADAQTCSSSSSVVSPLTVNGGRKTFGATASFEVASRSWLARCLAAFLQWSGCELAVTVVDAVVLGEEARTLPPLRFGTLARARSLGEGEPPRLRGEGERN